MASKVMDGPQQMDGTYLRRLDRLCIKIKILHKLFVRCMEKGGHSKKDGLGFIHAQVSYKSTKCRVRFEPSGIFINLKFNFCFLFTQEDVTINETNLNSRKTLLRMDT